MLTFRLPSYDCEHSSDYVLVATAVCLSYTDSDNAILQQKTETTHVSNFQLPLYSQPVGFGLLVQRLTHDADLPADMLTGGGPRLLKTRSSTPRSTVSKAYREPPLYSTR